MAVDWLQYQLLVPEIPNLIITSDAGSLDSRFRGFLQSVQTNTGAVGQDRFLPRASTLLNKPRDKQPGVCIWNTELCPVFRLFEIVSQETLRAQRPLLPAALRP
jgi:hypothetical protein